MENIHRNFTIMGLLVIGGRNDDFGPGLSAAITLECQFSLQFLHPPVNYIKACQMGV